MTASLTRRRILALASTAASIAALPLTSAKAFAHTKKHQAAKALHHVSGTAHHHRRHVKSCGTPNAFHLSHHRGPSFAPIPALPASGERRISFFNLHTRESIDLPYWQQGQYNPQVMRRIAWFMRDYRNGEVHPIDPQLMDLLHRLRATLRTDEPFNLISGYRSPQTNAMLVSMRGGVATNSLHMQGMAADVQLSDRSLPSLHNAALYLASGGVGYYPRSDFVHVDVGRVRQWRYG